MKQCSECKRQKDESEFHKSFGKKDGLASECRKCANIRSQQNRKGIYKPSKDSLGVGENGLMEYEVKICRNCDKSFKPHTNNQVFCNTKCQKNWWSNEYHPTSSNQKGKCVVCEKVFAKKTHENIICSTQCRVQQNQWKRSIPHTSNRKNTYYKLRFKVLTRDNFTCQYCGKTPQDGVKLQVDHIYPKSKGGKWTLNNLITSCAICNNGKSDVILSERLRRKLIERTEKQNKESDV